MVRTALDGHEIDNVSRGVVQIDSEHHEINEGRTFWADALNTAVAASGTLTLAANAANAETVTIDTKVYQFLTVLVDADGNVLIGATAAETLDNLVAAMHLTAGAGTAYAATMTAHTTCTGERVGDTLVVTANAQGTAGRRFGCCEKVNSRVQNSEYHKTRPHEG
jgi:hypothetical protein